MWTDSAMYEVTRLLHLRTPGDRHELDAVIARVSAAAAATGARTRLVSPTLPGSRNGGDVVVHLGFDSAEQWRIECAALDRATAGAPIVHVDSVEYRGANTGLPAGARRRRPATAGTVYRTLLLSVDERATDRRIEAFERALLRMPRYIGSMNAWQLSRVAEAGGRSRWTHVWEQEFADVDGLLGQYMDHPIHWASVDTFFDPENPACIVTERVCHSFCRAGGAVLGAPGPAPAVDAAV